MTVFDPEQQTEEMWAKAMASSPTKTLMDKHTKEHVDALVSYVDAGQGIDGEMTAEKTWQIGEYIVIVQNTRLIDRVT